MSLGNSVGTIMSTDDASTQTLTRGGDPDADELIDLLRQLPEPQALEFYSQLAPRLQWLARQKMTGQRRAALIAHHVITAGRCR
jgi:hypothetical protein